MRWLEEVACRRSGRARRRSGSSWVASCSTPVAPPTPCPTSKRRRDSFPSVRRPSTGWPRRAAPSATRPAPNRRWRDSPSSRRASAAPTATRKSSASRSTRRRRSRPRTSWSTRWRGSTRCRPSIPTTRASRRCGPRCSTRWGAGARPSSRSRRRSSACPTAPSTSTCRACSTCTPDEPPTPRPPSLRALAIDDRLAAAHALLAGALVKQGKAADALAHFDSAIELGADSPEVRLGYAEALKSLGRAKEADAQMEAYRRLASQR